MPSKSEIALVVAIELLRKSGVQEWNEPEKRLALAAAANELADLLYSGDSMALPDFFKVSPGTPKVLKSSGGDAAITLAGLGNGNGTSTGARQAATLDLGANWARRWRLDTEFEFAATPTAGYPVNIYASFGNATGAGRGNTSGADAAYTGYSNNIDAAAKGHLDMLGEHVCTSQATATVQKGAGWTFFPKGRYLNLVVDNRSGAAFHSSDANCLIRLTPLEEGIEDTV